MRPKSLLRRLMFWNHPQPEPETPAEKATRMRKALKRNPTTGEVLITQRYKDACIDEIMEDLRSL